MAEIDTNEESQAQEVCSICLAQLSRYTCPRCNVRYCSVACYRHERHLQCSESFYRDSVVTELQQMKGSGEERRHVMETLMRMQEGGEDDQNEDHVATLEERVSGLDLDRDLDQVWQCLTPSEQQQFNQLVQSGHVGHLFSLYLPWWETFTPVVDMTEQSSSSSSSSQKPSVLSGLPLLSSLVKDAKVSHSMLYNTLNALYAYAYVVRLYNGDHMELAMQASQAVLDISGTLSSNAVFCAVRDALSVAVTTVQQFQRKDLFMSLESSISVMRDVAHLLCHPTSHTCQVPEALSDLHQLLDRAKAASKAEGEKPDTRNSVKQLHRVAKKVFFFVVWSSEHAEELASLSDVVLLEYETSLQELNTYLETEQAVKAFRLPQSASKVSF
ncbi:hypothetical protein EMCRGX_G011811 [Ephydatia muelleri]